MRFRLKLYLKYLFNRKKYVRDLDRFDLSRFNLWNL